MRHFLKSILLPALTALFVMWPSMARSASAPDFNFPKHVASAAEVDLKTALKTGDGQKAVDAIVRYSLAKSKISKDNLTDVVNKIDSVANIERRPAYKALLYYFEASAFNSYMESYGVPSRKNPIGQRPADYTEWDNTQFNAKVNELLAKSLSNSDALKKCPVTDYPTIIKQDKDHRSAYTPTLFEFLSCKAHELSSDKSITSKWIAEATTVPAQIFASYTCSDQDDASMQKLYDKYKDNEHSGLFLLSCPSVNDFDGNDKPAVTIKSYYKTLTGYMERYPNSIYANNLQNNANRLISKLVRVHYKSDISSTDSIKVDVSYNNISKFTLSLYRVPSSLSSQKKKWSFPLAGLQLVDTRQVTFPSAEEPFDSTVTVSNAAAFAPQSYGEYIVVPSFNAGGSLQAQKNVSRSELFRIHDITMFLVNRLNAPQQVFVVDMRNGRPVKGASISSDKFSTGKTDKNGAFTIPSGVELAQINASVGADTYAPAINYYKGVLSRSHILLADIFTDLALYRPGETVKFATVCYYTDESTRKVMPGQRIKLTFLDANNQEIDSLNVVTDDFGRANGQFKVPTGRLNGDFTIQAEGDGFSYASTKSISVSEYKTPTFAVTFLNSNSSFTAGQDVTLKGKVETYSGMPVANTQVQLSLKSNAWSWWRIDDGNTQFLRTDSVTTDAKGQFSVTYPASLFKENDKQAARKIVFNRYTASAICTNSAGESQEKAYSFSIGAHRGVMFTKAYHELVFLNDKPFKLPVTYNSSIDTDTATLCSFTLSQNGKSLVSGKFNTSNPVIDLTSIASGKYNLKIGIADDSTAEGTEASIVLFRANDSRCPVDEAMWQPSCLRSIDANNVAHITIGTATPESHIYLIASNRNAIIKEGWLDYKPGMHKVSFNVPAATDGNVFVKLLCVYGNKSFIEDFTMQSPVNSDSIKIVASSFRNKLVSGSKEKWTFRVINKKQSPVNGAMLLSMTDKAINDIAENKWALNVMSFTNRPFDIRYSTPYYSTQTYLSWSAKGLRGRSFLSPEFNTYGQRMFESVMYLRGISENSRKLALNESVVAMADQLSEAPVAFLMKKSGSGSTFKADLTKVVPRTSEVKTALWRPALCTDANGNVTIEFDAPDFNTTWNVKAVAFNHELISDVFAQDVVTSKPLMVKSSLPRFVRQGDKTTLAATVQNATDAAIAYDAVIELFDPRTGNVLASRNFATSSISAKGTVPLTIDYAVPDTASFIGFRVKAANSTFSDGEQAMIPVLTAISPVIETKPFYIEPGKGESTVTLPQFASGSRVTLEYCDNPVWYCVQALPTIFTDNNVTASALAHNLFAATVAKGLAISNPKIKEAIDYWHSSSSDSALTSMLQRNSDLKIGTLMASPWVREADRQSLRMSRLADLFDDAKISSECNQIISKLKELQNSDGGWCWFRYPGCQSSLQTTLDVLQLIGEINRLGFMPASSDLTAMVGKALKYLDAKQIEIVNDRRKRHVKSIYSGFAPYIYTRTMFANEQSADTKQLIKNALKTMTTEWKGLTIVDKAYFAMALKRNGYGNVATTIVQSIREYAITKPATGMYWDNLQSGWRWFDKVALTSTVLEAMSEVGAPSNELDQIRKWILLNKQTNDWGSSSHAADAVYALLTTGSQWLTQNDAPTITLNGEKVEFSQTDRYLGYARKQISAASQGDITISRSAANPAWGAVYAQSKAPMTAIKAHSIADLSVTKEFLVYGADGQLRKATSLKVGDKVQVRTIIKNLKDLDFVTVTDERAACFEPADKTSGYRVADRDFYYLETKDSSSNIFFSDLRKGTHVISYDVYVTSPGTYNMGIATAQCQYAPQVTAHSAGQSIAVVDAK